MISWIQRYFHKHFRLVLFVVLIAVAVPMVLVYNQSSGSFTRSDTAAARARPYFNVNLGNDEEVRRMDGDAEISALLRRQPVYYAEQVRRYGMARVAGLAIADEMRLPPPAADEIQKFTAGLDGFKDAQGNFDAKAYAEFGDSLKSGKARWTTADVNRVLRDDARLEALQKVLGGPGYVQDSEIVEELKNRDSSWNLAIATLDYKAWDPGLAVTDAIVQKFYDENTFRYKIGPRLRASYVEFRATSFIPSVPPIEAEIRAFYDANPARFPVPADAAKKDAAPLALTPGATPAQPSADDNFAKVRMQVLAAVMQESALRSALKVANDLTVALYDRKLAANSPELAAFFATTGLKPVELPAFNSQVPPPNHGWLTSHAQQLAQLNPQRHFSDPVRTPDGFAVLFWQETLPEYTPALAEVKDKAAADYRDDEKRRRFIEHGKALREKLAAALKSGATFEKAAAAEKLEVKAFASVTGGNVPTDLPNTALNNLLDLQPGEIGAMTSDADKGYLTYVAARNHPDLTPANPRYALVRTYLTNQAAGTRFSEYLGKRVEEELKKTEPTPAAPAS